MNATVWHEVVLPGHTNSQACKHLLQHYRQGRLQEDLCFGLWTPATGANRQTSIVTDILLPEPSDRTLHSTGHVSLEQHFLARATREAVRRTQGLVVMHSHPSNGWQGMSDEDRRAERDRIADVARSTGCPLIGMTLGMDGHWSARLWKGDAKHRSCWPSTKVRVVEEGRMVVWQPPSSSRQRRARQRKTVQCWGEDRQRSIEGVRIGVVGLGSVGSVVAEGLARIGVRNIVLIDHDVVEEHNLDRLLNAGSRDIGRPKTDVAARAVRKASSAGQVKVVNVRKPVQDRRAYAVARDCDILVSCVDRPVARDVLNRIAFRDGIPVIDGGVEVRKSPTTDNMNAARWKAHVVNPYSQCLRCKEQYTSSDVMMELDGSIENPSYIRDIEPLTRGANVFNLSLSVGTEMLNMVIRLLISEAWWPTQQGIERNLVTARTKVQSESCWDGCTIHAEKWKGDTANALPYICEDIQRTNVLMAHVRRWRNMIKERRIRWRQVA